MACRTGKRIVRSARRIDRVACSGVCEPFAAGLHAANTLCRVEPARRLRALLGTKAQAGHAGLAVTKLLTQDNGIDLAARNGALVAQTVRGVP